ncbi:MAG: cyclase family protein [Actinobacteria bacterium]|nr:cyclase family protein [Actinomycetota bacterium]
MRANSSDGRPGAGGRQIVDLTRPLHTQTPVLQGDPAVSLTRVANHRSHGYQVTQICLGSHSGTHLDAPRHFFPGGAVLGDYPVARLIGEAVVVDVRLEAPSVIGRDFLARKLDQWPVNRGDFILLWTGRQHAGLDLDAARLLVAHGVTLVGTDASGLDDKPYPIHQLLLGADILLAENLCNLHLLGPGRVQCFFLPLAVADADGAPVRAVAWTLQPS